MQTLRKRPSCTNKGFLKKGSPGDPSVEREIHIRGTPADRINRTLHRFRPKKKKEKQNLPREGKEARLLSGNPRLKPGGQGRKPAGKRLSGRWIRHGSPEINPATRTES